MGVQLVLWVVLAGPDAASLVVGVPAALTGALLWLHLRPAPHAAPSVVRVPGFIAYFLRGALLGGFDIAMRALSPRMRVRPGFVVHHFALPAGLPRVVFMDALTLMPGTLSAEVEGDRLHVHVVDVDASPQRHVRELEQRVAWLFVLRGDHR